MTIETAIRLFASLWFLAVGIIGVNELHTEIERKKYLKRLYEGLERMKDD